MKNRKGCSFFLVPVALASMALASCSTTSEGPITTGDIVIQDPLEDVNRAIFAFNTVVDTALIHPTLKGYRAVVPQPARTGLKNFMRNLKSPVTFMNQVLQGDIHGAHDVFVRAAVNTFVGAGGLFDVAGYEGIEYEAEDFGQTLAVWGVGHGPYLVMPLLGPSSLRDYTGYAADSFADPLRYYLHNIDEEEIYYAKLGLDYLNIRDLFMDAQEDLKGNSLDYYAAIRSIYYQRREALVRDEDPDQTQVADFPEYEDF